MRILLFGTFDHFHPGHRFVIDEARKRGDVTVVVARDCNVHHIKGRVSDQSESERMAMVQEAYPDITVMLGDSVDFLAPVRTVAPDRILLGYDQRLPPGVRESDLPCPVERLSAFEPQKHKSSLYRKKSGGAGG